MTTNFGTASPVGRYFVLFSSLYANKPIFERELETRERTRLTRLANDQEESRTIKDYETLIEVSNQTRYCRLCMRLLTLFSHPALVLSIIYLYVMHFEIKIFPKGMRLTVVQNHDELVYSYGCIQTNCDSLFDAQSDASKSELNLDRLPIFSICHPEMSTYYEPFQHELGVGTTIYTAVIAICVLADYLIYLRQSGLLIDHSMLLFLVAPNLVYKVMLERAKQHLREVRHSYRNYLESERIKTLRKIELARLETVGDLGHIINLPTITISKLVVCKFNHIDETQFARDCLPLIRSKWWYEHLIELIKWIKVLPFIACLLVVALFYYYAYLANRMAGYMQEMQADVSRANCSIWRGDVKLIVDLARISFGLNILMASTTMSVIIFSLFLFAMMLSLNALISTWELRCWICELQYKLSMVQPIISDLFHWPSERDRLLGNNQQRETDLMFSHDKFRAKFMDEIHPSWLRIKHKSFVKFSKRVEDAQMLEENYYRAPRDSFQGDPEGDLAELLEKFYVELRLMNELRDTVEQRNSMTTIIAIVANYLVSFVSIYVIKMLGDYPVEPVFFVVVGNFFPIMFILNSVSVGTQACKLSPLVGSIVADLGLATNSQLKHMRSLWWRLADDLDPDTPARGGIDHIRFTYITAIQIVFSIATTFLFLLKA